MLSYTCKPLNHWKATQAVLQGKEEREEDGVSETENLIIRNINIILYRAIEDNLDKGFHDSLPN